MTLSAYLTIKQDEDTLHEDAVEFSEEQDGLWLDVLNWVVSAGVVARDLYAGPPPTPNPKLPRAAWDKELKERE